MKTIFLSFCINFIFRMKSILVGGGVEPPLQKLKIQLVEDFWHPRAAMIKRSPTIIQNQRSD